MSLQSRRQNQSKKSGIKFNLIRLQELNEFITKRDPFVVFLLSLNIVLYFGEVRLTDRERSIASLPREITNIGKYIMHPTGCVCL